MVSSSIEVAGGHLSASRERCGDPASLRMRRHLGHNAPGARAIPLAPGNHLGIAEERSAAE
jgi:hypothetical protein